MSDLLIIGAGPAGLAASIYASRYKLANLVIGKLLGGMMSWAHKVENYPGFPSIPGPDLTQKMVAQVKSLGAQILTSGVNPQINTIITIIELRVNQPSRWIIIQSIDNHRNTITRKNSKLIIIHSNPITLTT